MIIVVGSINIDLVASVKRAPDAGETTLASDYQVHHGGKGGNQAVAAARLGAPVRFIGAVGEDDFGAQLLDGLKNEGIDIAAIQRVPGASGIAMITLEHGGENRIIVVPGANGALTEDVLSDELFDDAEVVLVQLETPPAFVAAAITRAQAGGAEVVLNAAPAAPLDAIDMSQVDWLMVNAGEAAFLLGAEESRDQAGAEQHAAALHSAYDVGVVITLGKDGALWLDRDGGIGHTPAFATDVVDTTGAGDTFAGAFAVARMDGCPIDEAVRRASAAGALSVQRTGARGGMPDAGALAKRLEQTAG